MHLCIVAALAELGVRAKPFGQTASVPRSLEPFLCFQRRTADDLIVSGYKVVGSAQRRGQHGVLQHGSILLRASSAAPELPGCLDLCTAPAEEGGSVSILRDQIAVHAGRLLAVDFAIGTVSLAELDTAQLVEVERYKSPAWHARC